MLQKKVFIMIFIAFERYRLDLFNLYFVHIFIRKWFEYGIFTYAEPFAVFLG